MNVHFGRMKETRVTLVSPSETISEDLFQIFFIRSIAGDISSDLVERWSITHSSLKTTAFLFSCILQRIAGAEKVDELLFVKRKQFSNTMIGERKKVINITKCREKDHWAERKVSWNRYHKQPCWPKRIRKAAKSIQNQTNLTLHSTQSRSASI